MGEGVSLIFGEFKVLKDLTFPYLLSSSLAVSDSGLSNPFWIKSPSSPRSWPQTKRGPPRTLVWTLNTSLRTLGLATHVEHISLRFAEPFLGLRRTGDHEIWTTASSAPLLAHRLPNGTAATEKKGDKDSSGGFSNLQKRKMNTDLHVDV